MTTTMHGESATQHQPAVRILAGVAGRSLSMMVGMTVGAMNALAERRALAAPQRGRTLRPIAVGVSGGAMAAAAIAVGMTREHARQVAIDHPEQHVLGKRTFRTLLTRRALYAAPRIRELAHAIVGDRTFADFALDSSLPPHVDSSLLIPVFSAEHGTLLLPRDLPKLGLPDLPVADALVAATRIPGALPAAEGLEDLFDGGCQYRVPHEIFAPYPALILDLYGPRPHDGRGGLLFPLLHPSLPVVAHRPRPFGDPAVCESTIFARQPYGSALKPTTQSPAELFDIGYDIARTWIQSRSADQLRSVVDPHVLGMSDGPVATDRI